MPSGLVESAKLSEPIFTPSTKAELGEHDENITFEQAERLCGKDLAGQVRDVTLSIYNRARDLADARGIIIADTKFEFGIYEDELIWIDEALTPDSSRFWPKDQYRPGGPQPSFDKQFLRDYLETLEWGKTAPPPAAAGGDRPQNGRKVHGGPHPPHRSFLLTKPAGASSVGLLFFKLRPRPRLSPPPPHAEEPSARRPSSRRNRWPGKPDSAIRIQQFLNANLSEIKY